MLINSFKYSFIHGIIVKKKLKGLFTINVNSKKYHNGHGSLGTWQSKNPVQLTKGVHWSAASKRGTSVDGI